MLYERHDKRVYMYIHGGERCFRGKKRKYSSMRDMREEWLYIYVYNSMRERVGRGVISGIEMSRIYIEDTREDRQARKMRRKRYRVARYTRASDITARVEGYTYMRICTKSAMIHMFAALYTSIHMRTVKIYTGR